MLIAQLTDLHVRPVGLPANRVVETNMFVERAFRAVAAFTPRPDVILLTGDLTECGLDAEYANLARLIRHHLPPVPVFVIPGNHDRRERLRECLAHLPYVTADPVLRAVRRRGLPGAAGHAGHGGARRRPWRAAAGTIAVARPHAGACAGQADVDRHAPSALRLRHRAYGPDQAADAAAFAEVIARHPQVERIVCGHHHRVITTKFAQAIASISPSVAHQVEMSLHPDDPGAFVFEPPAFQVHRWTAEDGIVSHTVYVEHYPGPYPFVTDPEYPGRKAV